MTAQITIGEIDYDKLVDAILEHSVVMTPSETTLWDSKDCALYLRQSYRQFRERTAKHPSFPTPIQLPQTTVKSNNRWLAMDVVRWVENQKH